MFVRRDRETGEITPITREDVRVKIEGYYKDLDLALNSASQDNPLTTVYADYYPVKPNIANFKGGDMAYISRKSCGCLSMACVDGFHSRKDTAKVVAEAIMAGEAVERVTCEFVRQAAWLCQTHLEEQTAREVMERMQGKLKLT